VWVVPSDRGRTYFRQNCSQEFLAAYPAAYVEFRGQPGRSCGPWWRSYISDPLPGCTHDAKGILPPRRSPRLSRTPVAGSWIKAQRHQRWRSDLLCAATERGTLRTRLCAATHARLTLARWRGHRGHRLGRTQRCCFYEGGAVDRWERLRGGAFGFGLYKVRNAYASSSTTTSRAMRATCSGSARSPRAARLASSATQRASAASTPPRLTRRTSYTAAARGIRAPTGPLVPRCVLPPDTHPVHPRLGQGRARGIPVSGPHAVNLVNRWWQFHDTQSSSVEHLGGHGVPGPGHRRGAQLVRADPVDQRPTGRPARRTGVVRGRAQRRRRWLSRPCAG
jgi:hypothetical protein